MFGRVYRNLNLILPFFEKAVASPGSLLRALKQYAREQSPAAQPDFDPRPAFAGTEPISFRLSPSLADRPYLNVVLPGWAVFRMSGGPNTVINLAYRMAQKGVPVRFISASTPAEADPEPMWRHVAQLTGIQERPAQVEAVCGYDRSKA